MGGAGVVTTAVGSGAWEAAPVVIDNGGVDVAAPTLVAAAAVGTVTVSGAATLLASGRLVAAWVNVTSSGKMTCGNVTIDNFLDVRGSVAGGEGALVGEVTQIRAHRMAISGTIDCGLGELRLEASEALSVPAAGTVIARTVVVAAPTAVVQGGVSADGRGHPSASGPGRANTFGTADWSGAGAGHVGEGGSGTATGVAVAWVGGPAYTAAEDDDGVAPLQLGSGGGPSMSISPFEFNPGGAGGGIVRLDVEGELRVEGRVSADGAGGTKQPSWTYGSGGGSGGSVRVACGSLTGGGVVRASGGGGDRLAVHPGGGGGGGYVHVAVAQGGVVEVALEARGGWSNATSSELRQQVVGGAGVVILSLEGQPRMMEVDNGGAPTEKPTHFPTSFEGGVVVRAAHLEVDALTIPSGRLLMVEAGGRLGGCNVSGGGDVRMDGTWAAAQGGTVRVHVDGAVVVGAGSVVSAARVDLLADAIDIDGALDTTALGHPRGEGPGGAPPHRGGDHGGAGGCGPAAAACPDQPSLYGDALWPTAWGSGGAGSVADGGAGGGAISILSRGPCIVRGAVRANGGAGVDLSQSNGPGGGAGGSVAIACLSVTGGGTVAADGGDGVARGTSGGGGGGGRVAVYATDRLQLGALSAKGGGGGVPGAPGPVVTGRARVCRAYTELLSPAVVLFDNGGLAHARYATLPLVLSVAGADLTVASPAAVGVDGGVLYAGAITLAAGATLNVSAIVAERAAWADATVEGDPACFLEDASGTPWCTADLTGQTLRYPPDLPPPTICPDYVVPLSAVTDLTAESIGAYHVVVSWSFPLLNGANLTKNPLHFWSLEAAGYATEEAPPETLQATLGPFPANTDVTLSHRAYNGAYSPYAFLNVTTANASAVAAYAWRPATGSFVAGDPVFLPVFLRGEKNEHIFDVEEIDRLVLLVDPAGEASPYTAVFDAASGNLSLTVYPTTAGNVRMLLEAGGVELLSEAIALVPAAMQASQTTATGDYLTRAQALVPGNVTVFPRDLYGNMRPLSTACRDLLTVTLLPFGTPSFTDMPDGTCVVTVTMPLAAASATVSITIAREEIAGSPFSLVVEDAPIATTTSGVGQSIVVEEAPQSSATLIVAIIACVFIFCLCVAIGVLLATRKSKPRKLGEWQADDGATVRADPTTTAMTTMIEGLLSKKTTVAIGGGETSTVYKCRKDNKQWLCIKVLKEAFEHNMSATREFHKEANALSKLSALSHPNVVNLEFFSASRPCAVGIEFMTNGSLKTVLTKGRLDLKRKLELVHDAAAGLAAVHSCQIAHLDVKTDNCLIGKNGRLKIADFGISEFVDASGCLITEQNELGSVAPQPIAFTPHYVAPERIDGTLLVNLFLTDVYSYALVVYAIASQAEPHLGIMSVDFVKMLKDNPDLRPTVDDAWEPELKALMQECWATDPQARPTFDDVVQRQMFANVATCSPYLSVSYASVGGGGAEDGRTVRSVRDCSSLSPARTARSTSGVFLMSVNEASVGDAGANTSDSARSAEGLMSISEQPQQPQHHQHEHQHQHQHQAPAPAPPTMISEDAASAPSVLNLQSHV